MDRYKSIIQWLVNSEKQYPEHANYYRSYALMLLEEAQAIKEAESKKEKEFDSPQKQNIYYQPPSIPPRSQKPSLNNPAIQPQSQPQSQPFSNPSSLTRSDIQYAAAGVINQVQQFERDYQVVDNCKNAYTACANKARELNERYEVLEYRVYVMCRLVERHKNLVGR